MDNEKAVIVALCDAKDVSIFDTGIKGEMFKRFRVEFEWIMAFFHDYGTFPSKDAFNKQFPTFEWLVLTNPSIYYFEELKKETLYESMIVLTDELYKSLESIGRSKPDDVWELLLHGVSNISVAANPGHDFDWSNSGLERWNLYQERKTKQGILGYRSGWLQLDDILAGLQNGHLVVMAGVRSVGKTWAMCNMIYNVYNQKARPMVITCEMPADEIMRRLDCLAAKMPYENLRRGKLRLWQENLYKKWLDDKTRHPLIVVRPSDFVGSGVTQIVAKAQEIRPTILFIDGAHELNDDEKAKTRVEKIYNISKQLKRAALTLNIPVIASTHMKKEAEKGGDLSGISWSDSWARDADDVIEIVGESGS